MSEPDEQFELDDVDELDDLEDPDLEEAEERIEEALRDGATSLDLSDLQLRAVPPSLRDLTTLTELDLSGSGLRHCLNRWVTCLPSLTSI